MAIKILIVEDEQVLRENLCELLSMEGYEIRSAGNGIEGLKVLSNFIPDLILCDIKMSDMDGYEFIKSLRQSSVFVNIPFIYLSAKVEREDIRLGMNLGADDYLLKPFKRSDLLSAIDMRLKRKHELESGVREMYEEQNRKIKEEKEKFIQQIQALTKMEKKIVAAIADGLTTNEIAERFFISAKTVENHRYNIARKLNLQGANSVLAFALIHRNYFSSATEAA